MRIGRHLRTGDSQANKLRSSPSPTTTKGGDSQPASTGTSSETGTPSTPTSTLTPSAAPPGFPLGAYSLVTFLDSVLTDCTSDNATWTCAPYTNYYSDPQKALAVINWEITGSTGSYKISSKGPSDLYMTFQNAPLDLLDQGLDSERYRFQISRTKTVNMTGTIGNSRGAFECDYGATDLQAYLYTKMQRTYPDDTISVPNTPNTVWPYGEYYTHTLDPIRQLTWSQPHALSKPSAEAKTFPRAQSRQASKSPAASQRNPQAVCVRVCTRTGRLSWYPDANIRFPSARMPLLIFPCHENSLCIYRRISPMISTFPHLSCHHCSLVIPHVAFKPGRQKSIVSTR